MLVMTNRLNLFMLFILNIDSSESQNGPGLAFGFAWLAVPLGGCSPGAVRQGPKLFRANIPFRIGGSQRATCSGAVHTIPAHHCFSCCWNGDIQGFGGSGPSLRKELASTVATANPWRVYSAAW